MTIPPKQDTIAPILNTNTFRVWFDGTNQIIEKLNPLEFYSITADSGNNAGITVEVNRSTGAAVVGLDLPMHITGDHQFGGTIGFLDSVVFTGVTMDVSGTTLAGNVVRTLNGLTGDVVTSLVGVGLPGDIENGNILVYSPNGSTLVAYDLFTGGTFDANNSFRFGSSGGMQIGTGGIKYGSSNSLKGNVQIFGATGTQVSFYDASFDPTNESESGGHLFFGRIGRDNNDPMGLVYTGGRTEGF
jgi:hypothetical protein